MSTNDDFAFQQYDPDNDDNDDALFHLEKPEGQQDNLDDEEGGTRKETKPDQLDDLPEKYRGKSVEDIVRMHQEAEKLVSRQGQEIGEYRRLADTLLELQAAEKKHETNQEPQEQIKPEDFLNDPSSALERGLRTSSLARDTKEVKERIDNLEKGLRQQDFVRKHPGYQKDLNNPEFVDWIKKSRVRVSLAQSADKGNYDAADELWSLWDEYQELSSREKAQADNEDKSHMNQKSKDLEKAQLESGGNSDTGSAKRIYSRRKLIDLRIRAMQGDPEAQAKYNDPKFQSEIMRAYAEKRVR